MKKNMKWYIGAGVLLAGFIAILSLGLDGQLVYFYTPDEVFADTASFKDKNIRIGAMVKEGTYEWNSESLDLTFVATDYKTVNFEVHYSGAPPDLFKEGQGVVVEGKLTQIDPPIFKANKLMVKHSEEYKKPDAEHSMNKELLQKSLFK